MTELTAVFFVVLAVAAVVAVMRGASLVRGLRGPAPARWVKRSGRDRRRRRAPVAVERRRGSRREDDLANGFLSKIDAAPRSRR
jgi:hypothetical protein